MVVLYRDGIIRRFNDDDLEKIERYKRVGYTVYTGAESRKVLTPENKNFKPNKPLKP